MYIEIDPSHGHLLRRRGSDIDVQTGPAWGNKHVKYEGRYVRISGFVDGKVKSFRR